MNNKEIAKCDHTISRTFALCCNNLFIYGFTHSAQTCHPCQLILSISRVAQSLFRFKLYGIL